MQELVYYSSKGNPITDSVKIAEKFGKRHADVLRAIDELMLQVSDNQGRISAPLFYQVDNYVMLGSKEQNNRKYIISRDGFTLLVMGFKGKTALLFKLEYIEEFNRMEQKLKLISKQQAELSKHTVREFQIQNSKDVNAHQFNIGGCETVQDYNRENCKLVSGKTPSEWKKQAKAMGLKSKMRTSGKEVLRHLKPESACAASLNDSLVKKGVSLQEAATLTIPTMPLFLKMLEIGIVPAELNA